MAEDHLDDADLSCVRHLIIGTTTLRPDMAVAAMPRFNHALETCFGQSEVPRIAACMRAS